MPTGSWLIQVPAPRTCLKKRKNSSIRPPMTVDVGNHFGRRVKEVGGDADNAIGRWAGGAAFAATGFLMRRGFGLARPEPDDRGIDLNGSAHR
jgi:hypothetical protein